MSNTGPANWTMPIMAGDVAPCVINGTAVEAVSVSGFSQDQDEQGVYVETSAGQHVPHVVIGEPGAPVSTAPWEGEISADMVHEETTAIIMSAPALARVGQLEIWLDAWIIDTWLGTGAKTEFGLARSTGYESTNIAWADRPARCFVGTTEQTMVTGTPAAGECQLSQSADSTSITLGTAPASGAIVTLRYYPVRTGSASLAQELETYNDGSITLEVVEKIPVRSYP